MSLKILFTRIIIAPVIESTTSISMSVKADLKRDKFIVTSTNGEWLHCLLLGKLYGDEVRPVSVKLVTLRVGLALVMCR